MGMLLPLLDTVRGKRIALSELTQFIHQRITLCSVSLWAGIVASLHRGMKKNAGELAGQR